MVASELHWQLLLSPALNNLLSWTFNKRARDWFQRLVWKNIVWSAGANQELPARQLVWQVDRVHRERLHLVAPGATISLLAASKGAGRSSVAESPLLETHAGSQPGFLGSLSLMGCTAAPGCPTDKAYPAPTTVAASRAGPRWFPSHTAATKSTSCLSRVVVESSKLVRLGHQCLHILVIHIHQQNVNLSGQPLEKNAGSGLQQRRHEVRRLSVAQSRHLEQFLHLLEVCQLMRGNEVKSP